MCVVRPSDGEFMLDWYKGKRVFITGHTGFKGTWLSRMLLMAGADVTGYALDPPAAENIFEMTGTGESMTDIRGDVRDGEAVMKAMTEAKPDVVFHLAAQPLVRVSYREPVQTYETNVIGTVNVLEAVRHCPSVESVVIVTTDKVYKNKEWHWGYRENEELCGRDPYASSKSCAELVTYSYRASFFGGEGAPAVSTVRSGNVIGGGDRAADRIIPDCVRAARNGEKITVRNPASIRPYQHVLDPLWGYLMVAQKQTQDKAKYAGAWNFGPGDSSSVSTAQLADMFCAQYGGGLSWQHKGDAAAVHEDNFLSLDASLARTVLGWHSVWGIPEAIAHIVQWEKAVLGGESAADVTDRQIAEHKAHKA